MELSAAIGLTPTARPVGPRGQGGARLWLTLLASVTITSALGGWCGHVAAQQAPAAKGGAKAGKPKAEAGAGEAQPEQPPDLSARISALEAELAAQRAELTQLREQAAGQGSASAAELAALISAAEPVSAAEVINEPTLRAYGFADVGLQRMWADQQVRSFLTESDKTTFVLGNLNVYLDAHPAKDIRLLAEVRFGLMPNGATLRPPSGYGFEGIVTTTVSDPSAANNAFSSLKWAGVVPQRAHIDWTPSDAFNVRAGLFLTPYGIWNVDHGTPTRIMVSEPLFLSAQLIPNQLLGVEVFGTLQALPWTIGYHVHVSNGRTLGQIDFNDAKALGGRIFFSTRHPFVFKLGFSGYTGDSEDIPSVATARQTTLSFQEHALSADVSLDIGPLRIRSELVTSWTFYDRGKRPVVLGVPFADAMRLGTYLMVAYQLPWYGLEPLVMCELLRVPLPRSIPIGEGVYMPAVGLNVYFTATTMLRTQFALAHGFDLSSDSVHPHGFAYQAVSRLITAF